MQKSAATNTGGSRLIVSNTAWSFFGQAVPLAVAVFTIPLLIEGMGTGRFGMLMLAWAVVGYFSLFDMGLGRALTQLVAEKLGAGGGEEVPALIWTSLSIMLFISAAGSLAAAAFAPFLVEGVLNIPEELLSESLASFRLLSLSIPVVVVSSGLNGVLEARQMFRQISFIRIFMGAATFLGPLLVLPFYNSLTAVVAVLVAGRVAALACYFLLCLSAIPGLGRPGFMPGAVRPLLRFGGWMTVSNILSPVMVYMDRFLVGSMISVAAVSYYSTPYEVVTKLWIIPGALLSVLFPAFAQAGARGRSEVAFLYGRGLKYVFLSMFPVTLIIVGLAFEGMGAWLGAEFASNSAVVLQWLAAGIFLNSLARVPFTLLQGTGRPDITARLHIVELPFYLAALWLLTSRFGITGAAMAWTARTGAELVVLLVLSGRVINGGAALMHRTYWCTCGALAALALAAARMDFAVKGGLVLLALAAFAAAAWRFALAPDERAWFRLRPIQAILDLW